MTYTNPASEITTPRNTAAKRGAMFGFGRKKKEMSPEKLSALFSDADLAEIIEAARARSAAIPFKETLARAERVMKGEPLPESTAPEIPPIIAARLEKIMLERSRARWEQIVESRNRRNASTCTP